MTYSKCYCGLGCDFANPEEPCWGRTILMDYDDFISWAHICEGHLNKQEKGTYRLPTPPT